MPHRACVWCFWCCGCFSACVTRSGSPPVCRFPSPALPGDTLTYNARLTSMNRRAARFEGEVLIGDRVWLGSRVMVMKGVEIGDDSVIAAGAVVTSSIPAGEGGAISALNSVVVTSTGATPGI